MLSLGSAIGVVSHWLTPRHRRPKVTVMKYGLPEEQQQMPTMRVIMLADAVGYPDGFTKHSYAKGKEYDLPEDLAKCFFSAGQADPAEAHEQAEEARRMAARFSPRASICSEHQTPELGCPRCEALQPAAPQNAGATAPLVDGGLGHTPDATKQPPRPNSGRRQAKK
jgi:hypothetical protein